MTLNELNGLRHIDAEIKDIEEQLEKLRTEAESCTAKLDDMPKNSGVSDKVGRLACEIADYTTLLEETKAERTEKSREIHAYILNIENDYIRRVFYLRFVQGLTWRKVAERIGGGNTEDSVKKIVARYIVEK